MYCPNCGTQTNDETAKFCSACGFQVQSIELNTQEPTKHHRFKFSKGKIILMSIIAVVILFAIVTIAIITTSISEPTLTRCENLVGTPVKDVLNNDEFNITKLLDVRMATTNTSEVFGVSGKIQFVFTVDDAHIELVTWTSEDNTSLTESKIATFVEGMTKVYGKPEEASDNLYMWNTKQHNISVFIDDGKIMVTFC